ncbi:Exonuclease 1 [Vanrija pseudolonga]|uniref:Exonuclease 1 n=1 Tax=Vanrija pseudolonga TaxID=143232 RepID=A0AAF0Y312_9TREE|nr:Exonuclease 1 [Vanrija pseudolonga]
MGISGLLPSLKEIQQPRNISDFKGKRLAIDAYVWLHKGAFGCAEDLVKGKKTTKFVDYAMYRVRMLRYHGITPFVVFDGGPLPAKQGTEDSRAKSRAGHLARAQAFEAQGRLKEARDCYTKCLDITPEMAFQLIKALRAEGVSYIVAPYEADAQLCFLEREGFVDGVVTEDSDLLVFGCKTVIFKLEKDGSCISIERSRLAQVRELPMHGWTDVQFRRMAMLSGCDYLPSIPGIGLKKAHRMLRRYKTVEKLLQAIRLDGSHNIPSGYSEAFAQAELAFLYQRVFCPEKKCLVPLSDFPEAGLAGEDEKWIGLDVEEDIARGMAAGDLHPATRKPIDDLWPDFKPGSKGGNAPGLAFAATSSSTPKAGPLDSFFSRVKRTKSTPAVQPIGKMASGPTRLSDLNGIGRHSSDPGPETPPPAERKTSKFFGGKAAPADEPEDKFELKWEQSTQFASQQAGPSRERSATPEHIKSPSPSRSTLRETLQDDDGDVAFTSPVSVVSDVSSPPMSASPLKGRDPAKRPEPPSPTPNRVLVAASSQLPPPTMATCASSPMSTPLRRAHTTPITSRALTRITAVLVPASSPVVPNDSSDTIDDDDIVTPSPGALLKRRRVDQDEGDDEERERRARVVAEGWRQKYALKSAGSSSPAAPAPRKRTASMPVSAGARNILAPKATNVGHEPAPKVAAKTVVKATASDATPKAKVPAAVKIAAVTPCTAAATVATTPINAGVPSPHGLTWSSLERFRFHRR